MFHLESWSTWDGIGSDWDVCSNGSDEDGPSMDEWETAASAAAPEAVAEAAAPAPTTETIEDMKAQLMAENERLRQKAAMLDLGN